MIRTLASAPRTYLPEHAEVMLPESTVADVATLKAQGWSRMGILAAVFDPSGCLLMLKHRGSDKTPDGALGPLAETAQLSVSGGRVVAVESAAHTLSRGVHEELGIVEPSALKLRAQRIGAWALNDWPIGVSYEGQRALAICPVVHIDDDSPEFLCDTFTGTEEISEITFMHPHDVVSSQLVRPGTVEWVHTVMNSGLPSISRGGLEAVGLPGPDPLPDAVDIKMAELGQLV